MKTSASDSNKIPGSTCDHPAGRVEYARLPTAPQEDYIAHIARVCELCNTFLSAGKWNGLGGLRFEQEIGNDFLRAALVL